MKKTLCILMAVCLVILSLPLTASARTVTRATKVEKPVIEITNEPSNGKTWRLGDSMNVRARFDWPAQDESKGEGWSPDGIRFQVFCDGKRVEDIWHGWWMDEETGANYVNDTWFDIRYAGTMKLVYTIDWHHWYWVDDNDNLDEWVQSSVEQEIKIAKGPALGKLEISADNEPMEGKPLKLHFELPRIPDGEDPSFRSEISIMPYVQYTVTNKSTGKRVDIAPRAMIHEARLGDWQWWDDEKQQDVFMYGANVVATGELDKGTYVVKAKAIDKYGNHASSAEVTKEFKIGDPASGITINFDKDFYQMGEKATFTIDSEDARTFNIHIYAPDGNGDINKVVKAKNGAYKYTTDVLTDRMDIRVEVYQMDGLDLDTIASASAPVYADVQVTSDKKEYDVGDKAIFTFYAYQAAEFEVETVIQRADGTKEYKFNETLAAKDGYATYEMEMEEPQTVYLRVWGRTADNWGYDETRITVNVLDEDDKLVDLKTVKGLALKESSGKIALSWKAVTNAQQYIIYRRSGDDDFEEIDVVPDLKYVDKTAKTGVMYFYRVAAFAKNKNDIESVGPASVEKAFILLDASKTITAKSKTSKTMVVSWKAVTGAGAYEVYYTTAKKAPRVSTPGTKTTSELTLTVDGLKAKKTYYVYVRAIRNLDSGATIYGPWSKAATVKIAK